MARSNSAGVGCLGMVGFFALIGMCSDGGEYRPPGPILTAHTPQAYTPAPVTEEFYIHGALNVRSGPGQDHQVLRALRRGERVRLGPKGPTGWAPLYPSYGSSPDGYVYRASDLVRSYAPRAVGSGSGSSGAGVTRRSIATDRGYYRGPRGGCYTYSASGRKRYVDRSLCD